VSCKAQGSKATILRVLSSGAPFFLTPIRMGIDHFFEEGTRLENVAVRNKEAERMVAVCAAEKEQRSAKLFNEEA
jgi:hypothetical protein